MTKVKICGFTEAENARQAAIAGVDAIGLVFYDKSPRNIDILRAQEIIEALPPFVNRVGLFVMQTLALSMRFSVKCLWTPSSFMAMKAFLIAHSIKCLLLSRCVLSQKLMF